MTQHLDPTIPPNLDPTIPTVNLTYTTPPSRGGLITAVAVLLVLVGVAGGVLVSQQHNNNSASPSHISAAPSSTTPSPDPTYSTDQLFLVTVRRTASKDLSYFSDKELIDLAHTMCDTFAAGASYADVMDAGTSSGISAYDTAVLMGGAQTQYCPS